MQIYVTHLFPPLGRTPLSPSSSSILIVVRSLACPPFRPSPPSPSQARPTSATPTPPHLAFPAPHPTTRNETELFSLHHHDDSRTAGVCSGTPHASRRKPTHPHVTTSRRACPTSRSLDSAYRPSATGSGSRTTKTQTRNPR